MEPFLCILSLPTTHTDLAKSSNTDRCQERFPEYCTVNTAGGAQKVQQEEDRNYQDGPKCQLQNAVSISDNKGKLCRVRRGNLSQPATISVLYLLSQVASKNFPSILCRISTIKNLISYVFIQN